MSVQVNQSVANGFKAFPLDGFYFQSVPKFADSACLSEVEQAPWTNRVPQHEPWARCLMGNTAGANSANDESSRNTHHYPQFTDDGGQASRDIGRVEGTDVIERGEFWRR